MLRVRSARAEEADALTALCVRSKAHWGYDAEFMRLSAPGLTVKPEAIEEGRVLVAENQHGRLLGVAAVEPMQGSGKFDLTLLFVEPSAIRSGAGRILFEAAVGLVARTGGISLSILADPFAAPFYQHLGAAMIGEAPSDAIPGRLLPVFNYVIPPD
ncbi:MAG TPA: GNAT family N-acetyltransferase [Stellaceae bacterium]|nr:GNAT family N-acetyltransferase [Stellaceae bacterium]